MLQLRSATTSTTTLSLHIDVQSQIVVENAHVHCRGRSSSWNLSKLKIAAKLVFYTKCRDKDRNYI